MLSVSSYSSAAHCSLIFNRACFFSVGIGLGQQLAAPERQDMEGIYHKRKFVNLVCLSLSVEI